MTQPADPTQPMPSPYQPPAPGPAGYAQQPPAGPPGPPMPAPGPGPVGYPQQQPPAGHPGPPPGSSRPWWRRSRVLAPAALVLGFIFGAGAAGASDPAATTASSDTKTTVTVTQQSTVTESAAAPTTEAAAADPNYTPKPSDFKIDLIVTKKECFGSAGCNLTYRIKPTYVGTQPLPEDANYTITYQVTGGEDGPLVNSFTLEGSTAHFDGEELVSTSSRKAKLAVKATQVLQD